MKIRNPFNWALRFGTIPSEFSEAMTYEEQVMWLYYQIKEIKEGGSNYNYDLLENKPSIDGIVLQGNVTKTQLGIEQNYSILSNKPSINSVPLIGNKSLNELGIQGKLIAGSGIIISGNTISATGGGSGGTSDYNELSNLPSILGNVIQGNKTPEELGCQRRIYKALNDDIIESKYYDMANIQIGDTISGEPYNDLINSTTTDCIIISKIKGMHLELFGIIEMLITNINNEVVDKYSTELEALDFSADALTNGGYFIINFAKSEPPKIELDFTSTYIDEKFKQDNQIAFNYEEFILNSDGTITGFPDYQLEFSKFFLLDYGVYIGSISPSNLIFSAGEIVGFDYFEGVPTFYNTLKSIRYESGEWNIYANENIEDTLTNSRNKIPSSYAVYQAIQNISPSDNGFYTEIDSNITLNADGTISPTLSEGYYFLKSPHSITYYDNTTPATSYVFTDSIFYYDGEYTIKRTGINARTSNQIETKFIYSSGTNSWELYETDDSNFVQNNTGNTSFLRTSIPNTGDDNNTPTINAVRNYISSSDISRIEQATAISFTPATGYTVSGSAFYKYNGLLYISITLTKTSGTIPQGRNSLGTFNFSNIGFTSWNVGITYLSSDVNNTRKSCSSGLTGSGELLGFPEANTGNTFTTGFTIPYPSTIS